MKFFIFHFSLLWFRDRIYRSTRLKLFFKIDFLKNLAIFTGKHLCWSLFLIKYRSEGVQQLYYKETQIQVFSCEYSEIFKNRFFYRTLLMAASNNYESLQTSMGTVFLQKTYFWDPGEEIVKFLWGFLSERIMLGK